MSHPESFSLSHREVRAFLPHRSPFLYVDRVSSIRVPGEITPFDGKGREGVEVAALKNITADEPFFAGHFPEWPIVPGVLQIEMMAQTASFSVYPFVYQDLTRYQAKYLCVLAGVNSARFRKPVEPGDCLKISSKVLKVKGPLWVFEAQIEVEGIKVAQSELLMHLLEKET